MKSGACIHILRILFALLISISFLNVYAFPVLQRTKHHHHHHHQQQQRLGNHHLSMTVQRVEVCAGKDCKRSGGGPRLEKLIQQVIEEEGLTSTTTVERCYCQGECGYGPNVLADDKLINNVRGRDAVLQALGLTQDA